LATLEQGTALGRCKGCCALLLTDVTVTRSLTPVPVARLAHASKNIRPSCLAPKQRVR